MGGSGLEEWIRSVFPAFDPAAEPGPHPLPAAGSDRRLSRIDLPGRTVILVENPLSPGEDPNENDSFVYLSRHLRSAGLPAPEVYAYHREIGATLLQDLGDEDLFGLAKASGVNQHLIDLYREGLTLLAKMQVEAGRGLDLGRCHSPDRYDRHLMLSWESGYFHREFLDGLLGMGPSSEQVDLEYKRLAARAARAGADFFLHRDFQSRNLKRFEGALWIIDFQGARLGPAQYDLAALLFDPYVELPAEVRGELMGGYLEDFLGRSGLDRSRFLADFPFVALHRLMQALGAYAFLGHRRGKKEFLSFIPPALRLLDEAYRLLPEKDFPGLGRLFALARDRWEEVT